MIIVVLSKLRKLDGMCLSSKIIVQVMSLGLQLSKESAVRVSHILTINHNEGSLEIRNATKYRACADETQNRQQSEKNDLLDHFCCLVIQLFVMSDFVEGSP